ncbi:hypothetical protein ISD48_26005 [Pseudomonas aeruginosa]|nr:hypothetical protein [Pseudomonas aeruginosa]
MSTPPRIRGLVERLELAVKKHCHAKGVEKQIRKQEMLQARLEVLRAFAVVATQPKGEGQ